MEEEGSGFEERERERESKELGKIELTTFSNLVVWVVMRVSLRIAANRETN